MAGPSAAEISNALDGCHWPARAVKRATAIVTRRGFAGVLTAKQANALVRDTALTRARVMLALTKVASLYAVAPISKFRVGAVARGLSGNLYFGCNLEYEGQPLSSCSHAEQGATINAWLHGERRLTSLAVDAAPCGYCRQFLYETASASTLEIILPDQTTSLRCLLPSPFGPEHLEVKRRPEHLEVKRRLLEPRSNRLRLATPSGDPAIRAALEAANMCYAPHTKSFSGIGLLLKNDKTFRGPLAENAAYNPSLPPLQAALFAMRIAGHDFAEISRVALVEVQKPKVSQLDASRSLMRALPRAVRDLPIVYAKAVPDRRRRRSRKRAAGRSR